VTAAMAWIDSTAGVTEELGPTAANRSPLAATIIRGVLFIAGARDEGQGTRDDLLDISGRKVMDLHSGANDVRALAPGVYFVRAVRREPSAVSCSKVVIAR
jgi:hypothetical protein